MKDWDTLELSDEDFEGHWDDKFDAISTVYGLRPGHVLTQDDFDAIQKVDADWRDNEESAMAAFHRGYMQGLREGGSADIEEMRKKLDAQLVQLSVEKTMRQMAESRVDKLTTDIRDFIYALDRGYLDCKDDSAFIDALRAHVAPGSPEHPSPPDASGDALATGGEG